MKRRDSAVYALPETRVESNHRHTDFQFATLPYPARTRDQRVNCLLDMQVNNIWIPYSIPVDPAVACGTFAGVCPASLGTVLLSSP